MPLLTSGISSRLSSIAGVFVWVGALKIIAGSAGTATAGVIIATALYIPLVLGVGLAVTVDVISVLERRNHIRQSPA